MDWQHSSPYAVEDEEELNKDTAKGKYTTHQGAGDRVGQPALVRDLTRNLIGPHRLFNGLGGEPVTTTTTMHCKQQRSYLPQNTLVTLYPYHKLVKLHEYQTHIPLSPTVRCTTHLATYMCVSHNCAIHTCTASHKHHTLPSLADWKALDSQAF